MTKLSHKKCNVFKSFWVGFFWLLVCIAATVAVIYVGAYYNGAVFHQKLGDTFHYIISAIVLLGLSILLFPLLAGAFVIGIFVILTIVFVFWCVFIFPFLFPILLPGLIILLIIILLVRRRRS